MKQDALTIALHYLKFRPRSVFEIRKKLEAKRIENKEIEKVISVLKKNQLLDDEVFAKMWVRDRNLLKPTGSYLLKLELRKMGIGDEIIEAVLTPQSDEVLANKALEMKFRDRDIEYAKKVGFLQRRGFSTGVIYKVLRK